MGHYMRELKKPLKRGESWRQILKEEGGKLISDSPSLHLAGQYLEDYPDIDVALGWIEMDLQNLRRAKKALLNVREEEKCGGVKNSGNSGSSSREKRTQSSQGSILPMTSMDILVDPMTIRNLSSPAYHGKNA